MRATTASESSMRSICRRVREGGGKMSVYAASETNAIATGSWPGVCEEIGLVLVGYEGIVQVQVDGHILGVPIDTPDLVAAVVTAIQEMAVRPRLPGGQG